MRMPPLLSADGCCGGSFGYVDPFYYAPVDRPCSHRLVLIVATFDGVVELLRICLCILWSNQTLQLSGGMG